MCALHTCVCACMHAYIHLCVHACVYMLVCIFTCVHKLFACACMCVCVRVCVCVCVCIYVCAHEWIISYPNDIPAILQLYVKRHFLFGIYYITVIKNFVRPLRVNNYMSWSWAWSKSVYNIVIINTTRTECYIMIKVVDIIYYR